MTGGWEAETVRLRVVLSFSYQIGDHEEVVDTGITIDEWNAMSEEGRELTKSETYGEVLSNQDMGGVSVVTPGAVGR